MSLPSSVLSLIPFRITVSVFAALFFSVVQFTDTAAEWQARKTTFIPLLSFKLLVSVALTAIGIQTQADFKPLDECLNIGLLTFQTQEMFFSRNSLSWKAYSGTWGVVALFEILAIGKLTTLPHPSVFVPICLLLGIVRFCLSCAILALSVQAGATSSHASVTRKDNEHDNAWNWRAMAQIHIYWAMPSSLKECLALITLIIVACWETQATLHYIQQGNWKSGEANLEAEEGTMSPGSQRTFLSESNHELIRQDVLPAFVTFLQEYYSAKCEARTQRNATSHITLLDKQSFDKKDMSYKRAAVQQSLHATTPITTLLSDVVPGVCRFILIWTRLTSSHGDHSTTVICTIVVLKAIVESRFARELSRINKEKFSISMEQQSMRDDVWHNWALLELCGQLHKEVNRICNLGDGKSQLALKGITYNLFRQLAAGCMGWCGKIVPSCLTFGNQVLHKPSINRSGPTWQLYKLFQTMDRVTDPILSAPRRMLHAYSNAEPLRQMICIQPTKQYGNKELKPGKGSIRLNNVSFSYPDKEILNKVSVDIQSGETVAIVGRSGCGKSTFANLLTGQVDPTGGSIEIDGQSISSLQRNQLLPKVAILLQKPYTLNRSFAENIGIGKPDAPTADIINAAVKAQIHDDIQSYDMKYDTLISRNGSQLSGGQQQRLNIARVLARKTEIPSKTPSIFILDEPLQALDTITNRQVLKAIECSLSGSTVIHITHELDTIKYADRIFCFKGDGGFEVGNHRQLLAMEGTYKELWNGECEVRLESNSD
ncbi:unnamed protein product [Fusarium graminearum]|nr:unnamed protein product [Fusarium graminearum]